jgi:hypothetical protein
MRTWGRVYDEFGNATWTEVTTDANGYNDAVYVTTLIQTLKLNRGESPFYANYGIPAQQTVVTQVFPDFYVAQTQAQYSPFFSKLSLRRVSASTAGTAPIYDVNITTKTGATIAAVIPV